MAAAMLSMLSEEFAHELISGELGKFWRHSNSGTPPKNEAPGSVV